METIDSAFYAMDDASRDPAAITLYYNLLGCNTGLSVTIADLDRLFLLMAKAAHLFRLHDGPAPEGWADTWKGKASECTAVCEAASKEYLSLCIGRGQPIAGEIRRRLNSWNYMAGLFASWPARSGCTALEPSTIAAAAGIHSAEADMEAKMEPTLYHLNTTLNQQELARIFTRLVNDGFIDGSAPDAQADFLNAFNPFTKKQGRITWIWTDKRQGKPSPRHILDFVAQMDGGRVEGITPELYNKTAPAIFGRPFRRDIVSEFITRWNAEKYCDTHANIHAIISGR